MQDAALGESRLDEPSEPPEPIPPVTHDPLTAEEGTIAYAKLNGGSVTLEGKVVTAVFRRVGYATVDFFYIQEQDCPSGIKVMGECGSDVEAGDVVTVEGTVVGGSGVAECYIDADDVDITGTAAIPAPLGMNNRATAGAQFGLQQALYLDSSDANRVGAGLNAVGTRVRVYGRIVYVEGQPYTIGDIAHYIDDGSGLISGTDVGPRLGLRLISWQGYSLPEYVVNDNPYNDYVVATGILGAEMSADERPVPVIRIPGPEKRAHILVTSGNSIQTAINQAAAQTPKSEVWVCAGTYYESVTIPDGVAVYGGFTGSPTKREQRNWVSSNTTIDGGGATPCHSIQPSRRLRALMASHCATATLPLGEGSTAGPVLNQPSRTAP